MNIGENRVMQLENDYAIIESLAEWELFGFDFEADTSLKNIRMGLKGNDWKHKVIKEQVKEKLQFTKKDKFYFRFVQGYPNFGNKTEPDYLQIIEHPDTVLNYCDYTYYLPVNPITINKSIQELYKLGKWVGLWE